MDAIQKNFAQQLAKTGDNIDDKLKLLLEYVVKVGDAQSTTNSEQ